MVTTATDIVASATSARHGFPDRLLLDSPLPGTNGSHALPTIRVGKSQSPVMLILAPEGPGRAEWMHTLGPAAYRKKPVDGEMLLAAIEAATVRNSMSRTTIHPQTKAYESQLS